MLNGFFIQYLGVRGTTEWDLNHRNILLALLLTLFSRNGNEDTGKVKISDSTCLYLAYSQLPLCFILIQMKLKKYKIIMPLDYLFEILHP